MQPSSLGDAVTCVGGIDCFLCGKGVADFSTVQVLKMIAHIRKDERLEFKFERSEFEK